MMSDLGDRMNVMGPQPIIKRFVIPPEMIATAERVLTLLAAGDTAAVASMAAPGRETDLSALAAAVKAGIYDRHQIIATARVNFHHYVKARLYGPRVEAFTMQLRLGEHNGEWRVWEAQNLTGRRGAWTR